MATTLGTFGSGSGGSSYTDEEARDALATALTAGTNVTITPNDGANTITVATSATVNSSDATLLARANHTGTQSADTLTDGTTNKAFLATERTKLSGVATSATANSSDATLLARANHTGTQSADTLTDGTTNKAFLATERTKLSGIATGATAYTDEDARDALGAALTAGANVTVAVDDAGNTITVTAHPINGLTAGEATIPRDGSLTNGATTSTGNLRLTYFTARKTETTTQVYLISGSTAAGATPTLCRIGLYQIDGSGNGTLVASTANDTALFAAANTAYTKSWSSSFAKVAGTRYALGVLVVTASAAPTVVGWVPTTGPALVLATAPRIAGRLTSQTDLPSTFTEASLTSTTPSTTYAEILP